MSRIIVDECGKAWFESKWELQEAREREPERARELRELRNQRIVLGGVAVFLLGLDGVLFFLLTESFFWSCVITGVLLPVLIFRTLSVDPDDDEAPGMAILAFVLFLVILLLLLGAQS